MACSSCAKRRAAAGRRPTMMRVEQTLFEVVSPDGRRTQYEDLESARAARGDGQIRRRVAFNDVPAEYAVRLDDSEIARFARAMDAAEASKEYPGSQVFMVAAGT